MRIPRSCGALAALIVLAGCNEQLPTETPHAPAFLVNGSGRLAIYNGGVDRAVPARPCMQDERYRQFDFWLGAWDAGPVASPTPTTRSAITSLLDGCVVHEEWAGGAGRSINTFDRDDGMWHQTWVGSGLGHLRMSGGLDGSEMVLSGLRTQLNGVVWSDTYRWTPQGADQVQQAFNTVVRFGENILFQGGGALRYTRPPTLPVPAPPANANCVSGNGAPTRLLDFWLGEWSVAGEAGPTLGTATVGTSVNQCLIEENYATEKGYGSVSFAYYDVIEQRWYRTIIDSEGERIELSGQLVDGALVLTGMEPGPGGKVFHVRMTLEPVDADTLHQTWETSADGESWRQDMLLVYRRA
jgi:hypothetical protein